MRVALLVLTALAAAACGTARRPAAPERLPGTALPPAVVQGQPLEVARLLQGQRDVVAVAVSDDDIRPAVLQGRVGVELHLHLVNRGRRQHNFLIPAFGIVTQPMPPGGENYVAFTPSRAGTFPYFSGDPRDRTPEPGLEGRLQVSP